jgi:peroxiredoxin Q/BCP
MLEPGATIPKLKGATADGSVIDLAALRGQWVVVYFYPKDNTPGCTTEAQEFRDHAAQFKTRNAVIIGVSRDSVKSHHNFTCKHELPFALVSDADETWCKAFDVIHEKVLYGKHYLGIVRSTFLIDPKGKLAQAWRGVKVAGHAAAVLGSIPSA